MAGRSLRMSSLCALVALAGADRVHAADGAGWDWYAVPYVWIPDITVDVDTRFASGGESDDSFPEALDDLDGAFLGRLEGRGDRFGFYVDVTFMGLGGGEDYTRVATDVELDATVVDVALVYSPGDDRESGFDLFGGLRYVDVDIDVAIDPFAPERSERSIDASESFSDLLVGARYTGRFRASGRWSYTLQGDASWGDTEGTWSASAMAHYRVGMGAWLFGYRYLTGELEPERVTIDADLHGPIVGFAFAF